MDALIGDPSKAEEKLGGEGHRPRTRTRPHHGGRGPRGPGAQAPHADRPSPAHLGPRGRPHEHRTA
ncbi:hypothetical protein QJS66_11460 [Kocuria rhizophila]|nr:hypothetical protein QJS66_11460 [Kocuria rhizophila]